jgi:hypothetical protein
VESGRKKRFGDVGERGGLFKEQRMGPFFYGREALGGRQGRHREKGRHRKETDGREERSSCQGTRCPTWESTCLG